MNSVKGFTLIELMITVVIIGILAAIAIPNYTSFIRKSHRAGAVTAVLELASRQARYYTTHNAYSTSMLTLGYATDPVAIENTQSHYYNLSVASATAAGFSVSAVPRGSQASDACGTFLYSDLGKRELSGNTASVSECWKQ